MRPRSREAPRKVGTLEARGGANASPRSRRRGAPSGQASRGTDPPETSCAPAGRSSSAPCRYEAQAGTVLQPAAGTGLVTLQPGTPSKVLVAVKSIAMPLQPQLIPLLAE